MRFNESRLVRLKDNIQNIIEKLKSVPSRQKERATSVVTACRECLDHVPATDTPVYVHIMGTDKSFKTSYLLDLFDHEALGHLFSVKAHNTSENTAVPCLVEPSDAVTRIVIRQLAISTGQIIRDDISPDLFGKLYDLSQGAVPDDYLLQVLVPAPETPMTLPVIEYPGIKEGADAMETHRALHKTFEKNLVDNLIRFPGILVACFQHKIAIPPGHPMDIILKKYREVLNTGPLDRKLPLVVSLQGESAIAGYCGNTNVQKDIATDFKSYTAFDTMIQLVNPCNGSYPVTFGAPGPYVEGWISGLSRYKNLGEIQENITLDGGISWSRATLESICGGETIREALDIIFLMPWITEAENCIADAMAALNEIETYDEVAEIKEKMRKLIVQERYHSIRTYFKNEMATQADGIVDNHDRFWNSVFAQYLMQFFDDDEMCQQVSQGLWQNLRQRLDGGNKGFLGTREEDLPYIIMNSAELYVPNALIRGDIAVMGRALEDE
ncbi:hypothetical protein SAMN02746065_104113 [Desulfocicer vacuolatum DSM 3385]|uniref:Uncharacterized protein n=1 Tax=Desulfocicer vacuolatum DSM 3385 TaxID=1121400 RepID=A0A1W2A5A5_9BACT|nr:hypothetical protein [Desulfocicer vacuolatum]SMC55611.1 hypothetical protein SAMN02746065_104113 [Desulfocicer vacuolatum DSM 3385]